MTINWDKESKVYKYKISWFGFLPVHSDINQRPNRITSLLRVINSQLNRTIKKRLVPLWFRSVLWFSVIMHTPSLNWKWRKEFNEAENDVQKLPLKSIYIFGMFYRNLENSNQGIVTINRVYEAAVNKLTYWNSWAYMLNVNCQSIKKGFGDSLFAKGFGRYARNSGM